MTIRSKLRIYKTCIRPVLTYAAETRADTAKTKRILRTAEMKTLRTIEELILEIEYEANKEGRIARYKT